VKLERLESIRNTAAHAELEKLTRRFEEAQQRERVALARRRGQLSTVSPADRARRLSPAVLSRVHRPRPNSRRREEMVILRQAMYAARDKLDAVRRSLA